MTCLLCGVQYDVELDAWYCRECELSKPSELEQVQLDKNWKALSEYQPPPDEEDGDDKEPDYKSLF